MGQSIRARVGGGLDRLHRACGKSAVLTHLAVKIRNQCDAVIRASLTDGIDPVRNGELWLVQSLRGKIRRFIDVGANVGAWTSLVVENEPEAEGVCFEPAPSALSILSARASTWKKVKVLPQAVSDNCGSMQFLDFGGGSETSGEASVVSAAVTGGQLVTVPAVTIDSACADLGWGEVDLLKIDAEGLDWRVLRGSAALLREGRVRVVQFEYGGYWIASGGTLASTIGFLESCGYAVFRLRGQGLSPVDLPRYGEYYGYSNFVAIRKNDEELLRLGRPHGTD